MNRRQKTIAAMVIGLLIACLAVFLLIFQGIQKELTPHRYEIHLKNDRDFATDEIKYDGVWIEFHDKWSDRTFRLPAQNIVIETIDSLRK